LSRVAAASGGGVPMLWPKSRLETESFCLVLAEPDRLKGLVRALPALESVTVATAASFTISEEILRSSSEELLEEAVVVRRHWLDFDIVTKWRKTWTETLFVQKKTNTILADCTFEQE
jgi:hypothetical protein